MFDLPSLDWNVIIQILTGGLVAAVVTVFYNWQIKKRELSLQKSAKRVDWFMQSSGRYYRIFITTAELETRLKDPIIDYELCFFLIIQYFQTFRELYDNEASYFFDDIEGEFFLLFLEGRINDILKSDDLFGLRWRILRTVLDKDQTVTDLHEILTNTDNEEIRQLFKRFKDYLEKKGKATDLSKRLFVYRSVLLYEINKLLIAVYKNERKTRNTLADYFSSPQLPNLQEELRPLIVEFKRKQHMKFKMFGVFKRAVMK